MLACTSTISACHGEISGSCCITRSRAAAAAAVAAREYARTSARFRGSCSSARPYA
jgi:hypothetical protein